MSEIRVLKPEQLDSRMIAPEELEVIPGDEFKNFLSEFLAQSLRQIMHESSSVVSNPEFLRKLQINLRDIIEAEYGADYQKTAQLTRANLHLWWGEILRTGEWITFAQAGEFSPDV